MSARSAILFASDDLLVRHVSGEGGRALCYITYASYTDERTLYRPGFGEAFFRDRGIDAIHVISRDNEWYQYPEWDEAIAAVAAAAGGYDRVIAYGSSMGGFAALHYGAACGATIGIAISPQYSVDPAIAPFEDRWAEDIARIRFRGDVTQPLPRQYIVYDPIDANDRRHFQLYARRSPTIGLPAHHGGHPAGSHILQTGMFAPLFEGALADGIDPSAFSAGLRAGRRRSGQYLFTLSNRVAARRLPLKIALARMAVDATGEPIFMSHLARLLDQAGQFGEAARQHRAALQLEPDNLHVRHGHAQHHELAGNLDRARTLIDALARDHPGVATVQESRARIRRRCRHRWPGGRLLTLARLDARLDRALDWLGRRGRRSGP